MWQVGEIRKFDELPRDVVFAQKYKGGPVRLRLLAVHEPEVLEFDAIASSGAKRPLEEGPSPRKRLYFDPQGSFVWDLLGGRITAGQRLTGSPQLDFTPDFAENGVYSVYLTANVLADRAYEVRVRLNETVEVPASAVVTYKNVEELFMGTPFIPTYANALRSMLDNELFRLEGLHAKITDPFYRNRLPPRPMLKPLAMLVEMEWDWNNVGHWFYYFAGLQDIFHHNDLFYFEDLIEAKFMAFLNLLLKDYPERFLTWAVHLQLISAFLNVGKRFAREMVGLKVPLIGAGLAFPYTTQTLFIDKGYLTTVREWTVPYEIFAHLGGYTFTEIQFQLSCRQTAQWRLVLQQEFVNLFEMDVVPAEFERVTSLYNAYYFEFNEGLIVDTTFCEYWRSAAPAHYAEWVGELEPLVFNAREVESVPKTATQTLMYQSAGVHRKTINLREILLAMATRNGISLFMQTLRLNWVLFQITNSYTQYVYYPLNEVLAPFGYMEQPSYVDLQYSNNRPRQHDWGAQSAISRLLIIAIGGILKGDIVDEQLLSHRTSAVMNDTPPSDLTLVNMARRLEANLDAEQRRRRDNAFQNLLAESVPVPLRRQNALTPTHEALFNPQRRPDETTEEFNRRVEADLLAELARLQTTSPARPAARRRARLQPGRKR